jgi:hypothetical protein
MNKIVILGILMSVMACNQNIKTENTKKEQKEIIRSLLKQMYYEDVYMESPLDNTLIFTKEVVALNKQCDSVTDADAERIAKSDFPTDKPYMREGSLISSLYEGVTHFYINDIKTVKEQTIVTVTLSNKHYPSQKQWKEKIIFINQNGLKIDNIYFDNDLLDTTKPNLKKSLMIFIKQTNECAISS